MKLHRLLQNASAQALVIGMALALPTAGAAQTWTGAVDSDYNNPGNWSTGTVPPTSGTVVTVNGTANAPVLDGGTASASSGLIVGDGGATAGQLTVRGGGQLIGIGQTSIGGSNSGIAGGDGTVLVTGAGSLLQNTNQIIVGLSRNSRGTLTVESGATVRGNAGIFGAGEGSVAEVTVRGANSLLDLTGGLLNMGSNDVNAGRATLDILAGGRVNGSAGTTNFVNAVSAINISGANSVLSSGAGLSINGTLLIEDGGALNYAQGIAIGGAATMRSGTMSTAGSSGLGVTAGGTLIADNSTISAAVQFNLAGAATLRGTGLSAAQIGISQNGVLNIGGADGGPAGAAGTLTSQSITVGEPNSRLVFNHTGPDLVVGATIGGNGRMLQRSGTTVLTAANPGGSSITAIDLTGGTLFSNGNLRANTMAVGSGATLGGTGIVEGLVAVTDGILTPGFRSVGNLTLGNLTLTAASVLNFDVSLPGPNGRDSDLITLGTVNTAGNLTLDGTININSQQFTGFGIGSYRLINYKGALTNNGLDLGTTGAGFTPGNGNIAIQTSVANQVNLITGTPNSLTFWDGANTTANQIVDGGTGRWTVTGTNWSVASGATNGAVDSTKLLIFSGTGGTVTVDNTAGPVTALANLQFASDGYRVQGGAIGFGEGFLTIRVGDGTAAGAAITSTIASNLTGTRLGTTSLARLTTTDLGTLVLTGNSNILGTVDIETGTLRVEGGAQLTSGGLNVGGGSLTPASTAVGLVVSGAGTVFDIQTGQLTTGQTLPGGRGATIDVLGGGELRDSKFLAHSLGSGSVLTVSGSGSLLNLSSPIGMQGDLLVEKGAIARIGPVSMAGAGRTFIVREGAKVEALAGDGPWSINDSRSVLIQGQGTSFTSVVPLGLNTTNFVVEDKASVTVTGGGSSVGNDGTLSTIDVRSGGSFNLAVQNNPVFGMRNTQLRVTDATFANSGSISTDGATGSTISLKNSNFSARDVVLLGARDRLILGGDIGEAANAVGRFDVGSIRLQQPNASMVLNYTGPGLTINADFGGEGTIRHLAGDTRFTGNANGNANQWRGNTLLSGGSLAVDGGFFGDGSGALTAMTVSGGATLSGRGAIGGVVTVADGTIRPGGDALNATGTLLGGNAVGNLTFTGNLALSAASRLAYQLGAPSGAAGVASDLISIGGNLTLDGTLDVASTGAFGAGLYRLINYNGTLTDNGLLVGATPTGFTSADLTVQTSVARQVSLLVGTPAAPAILNFWDGANTAGNNLVDGGTGTWSVGRTNWTNAGGTSNGRYDRNATLIFAGTGGVVTIDNGSAPGVDNPQVTIFDTNQLAPTGMQFASTGYRLQGGDLSFGGGDGIATIRVGDGTAAGAAINATIASNLILANRLDKTDLGTLTLTGQNLFLPGGGRSQVRGGTLDIAGGGQMLTGGLDIALAQAATFRVTGAGSTASVGTGIRTGSVANGPGTIEVLDGGTLRDSARGGNEFGAGSQVRVSGAGSVLDLANISTSQGSFVVENDGVARVAPIAFTSTGSLVVRSGGRIEPTRGDTTLGSGPWRVTNGLIQGAGSAFNSVFALSIAPATPSNPATNFIVEDGASVTVATNTDSGLGFNGPLSTLIVRNGATFTLTGGSNAGLQTENARLTVDNATFAIGGELLAGQRFGNTAIVLRDADFTARSVLLRSATDSLAIGAAAGEAAGGIRRFDVGTLALGDVATTLTLNHDAADFALASTINGAGAIRQLAGDTRLTGDSRFFGGQTIVTGGALRVDNLFGDAGQRMTISGGAALSGRGTIGGAVTIADGTIRPGGDALNATGPLLGGNAVGTLNVGGPLMLGAASRLAFQLGAPNTPGVGSDLINVGGNLTLDGMVDITNAGGFGAGLYRLINYGGTLTDNGLLVGAVPGGFNATDLTVQTSVAQQVNLIVGAPPPAFTSFNFWDGSNAAANRAVDGGTGNWTTTGRNWTVTTGEANGVYDPTQLLIFAGNGGVATVDTTPGAVVVGRGLQFAVNGYRVEGGALTLGTNATTLRVGDGTAAGSGITATIASDLIGGTSIEKTDLGTLILTGSAAPTAGTTITSGTLQIGAGGTAGSIGGNIANNGALVFNREGALAYGGVISGSGTLEQRGPGTTTLSGVHSYTGLTTVSAGTLANSGTIVGATSVLATGTLSNAGTLAAVTNAGNGINTGTIGALTNTAGSFTNNGTINGAVGNSAGATFATTSTLNGSLINSGTARIAGIVNGALDNRAGSVTATAATTGIGTLTQNAGATLNLAGFALTAGSIAGDGTVQLGAGTLTTGGSNASTAFTGIISGTGSLVKTGTGQLTLTGANTYSGGTVVTAGTLTGNATSLQGAIANDGRVRLDQSAAGSYAGALSGTGLLEKAGVGRLDLTGVGTMSGGTSVLGGELAVNGSLARSIVTVGTGARLGGSGTVGGIVAQSGATVAPGNSVGTLTVQGNVVFAAGSTFAIEVQGATADRITASGTAQLAGTLAVTAVAGPYTFGTPYVLLSAVGGRTGTFDTATGLAGFGPGIRPTVSYDATTVTLRLDPNALGPILTGVTLTPNQRSAQQRFDAAIAGGSTNPVPFFAIFNLPVAQLPTALDALSAEVYATSARLALDDERMVRKSTLDQLRSTGETSGTTAWGAAFGTFGTIASDGNAARVTRDTSGFITGIDTGGALDGADSGWRIGIQGHHLRTSFGITDRASSGSITRTGGGIHGAITLGGIGIRAGATLASVKIKTTRAIAATGFSEQGVAAVTGTAFQAFGEIGYTLGDSHASIEPFAGLAVSRLKLNAIAENGGVSAVTVRARDYALTLADLGLRGRLRMTPGDRSAIDLKAALAIRQVIGGQALAAGIAFASASALDFSIATVAQDKTSFAPEIGLDADLGGGATVQLTYSGVIGKRAQDHGIKAGIRIAF